MIYSTNIDTKGIDFRIVSDVNYIDPNFERWILSYIRMDFSFREKETVEEHFDYMDINSDLIKDFRDNIKNFISIAFPEENLDVDVTYGFENVRFPSNQAILFFYIDIYRTNVRLHFTKGTSALLQKSHSKDDVENIRRTIESSLRIREYDENVYKNVATDILKTFTDESDKLKFSIEGDKIVGYCATIRNTYSVEKY